MGVSSRTYLSIGDVLGLLRQEFPDVTISKRSDSSRAKGLVNPERTPSGYRKFYEHDVGSACAGSCASSVSISCRSR